MEKRGIFVRKNSTMVGHGLIINVGTLIEDNECWIVSPYGSYNTTYGRRFRKYTYPIHVQKTAPLV